MIDAINKTVGCLLDPLFVGIIMIVVAALLLYKNKTVPSRWLLLIDALWFWFWGMPIAGDWLALPLEEQYPVVSVDEVPEADAIVLLGGGVWGMASFPYADLNDGADRPWHAARLWKAGKAPIIVASSKDVQYCDVRFLQDLGVPMEAIIIEDKAVNTEENARFVKEVLGHVSSSNTVRNVLVVTSAIHMRRSLYMFEKYASDLNCFPAATDYQALPYVDAKFKWRKILPSVVAFAHNNASLHEYIGYWGYKCFR